MVSGKRYARTASGVKGRRASIEAFLDSMGWPWDGGLSLLLDAAILADEGGT